MPGDDDTTNYTVAPNDVRDRIHPLAVGQHPWGPDLSSIDRKLGAVLFHYSLSKATVKLLKDSGIVNLSAARTAHPNSVPQVYKKIEPQVPIFEYPRLISAMKRIAESTNDTVFKALVTVPKPVTTSMPPASTTPTAAPRTTATTTSVSTSTGSSTSVPPASASATGAPVPPTVSVAKSAAQTKVVTSTKTKPTTSTASAVASAAVVTTAAATTAAATVATPSSSTSASSKIVYDDTDDDDEFQFYDNADEDDDDSTGAPPSKVRLYDNSFLSLFNAIATKVGL
jgi:hypothetical protein